MKLHAWYCAPLWQDEKMLLFGLAGGRVDNAPDSRWLYSLRIFMGVFKVEILWTTGAGLKWDAERFRVLAVKEAFGTLDERESRELEALTVLRRRPEPPVPLLDFGPTRGRQQPKPFDSPRRKGRR